MTRGLAECTASLLTARGRGAVASIRVCRSSVNGPTDVFMQFPFHAANGKTLDQQSVNQIVFGRWGRDPGEEIVLCRTHVDRVEIHCHGGLAAAERIQADLHALGITIVDWDEQVRRNSGRLDRECEVALSQAGTNRTAIRLLAQHAAWRTSLRDWRSLLEQTVWKDLLDSVEQVSTWAEFGRHLTEPFRVVLTGQPNVGKSALINALVGYNRSIVFDQPGTTRDVVTSDTVWDGWPILLADTAGLRPDAMGLEASGIELASDQISKADLIVLVLDATAMLDPNRDAYLVEKLRGQSSKIITVANKIDLLPNGTESSDFATEIDFLISARKGTGLDALIQAACRKLVPSLPAIDVPIPFSSGLIQWLKGLAVLIESRSIEGIHGHLKMLVSI